MKVAIDNKGLVVILSPAEVEQLKKCSIVGWLPSWWDHSRVAVTVRTPDVPEDETWPECDC